MNHQDVIAELGALQVKRTETGAVGVFSTDDSTPLAEIPPLRSEEDLGALIKVFETFEKQGFARANKRIASISDKTLFI